MPLFSYDGFEFITMKSAKEDTPEKPTWKSRIRPNPYLLTLALVLIVLLIVIISIILTLKAMQPPPLLSRKDLIACPGKEGKEECIKRLCHYAETKIGPKCYMEKDEFSYWVIDTDEEPDGPRVYLQSDSPETPYGKAFDNVNFKITYLTEHILRFQFKDADHERYEVPAQEHFPLLQKNETVNDASKLAYEVQFTNDSQLFHFKINRKDGMTLWDTTLGALVMSNQFLQIGSYLPSKNVYGLGEHVHDSLRHSMDYKSWPMFSRDNFPKSRADGKNLYSVHPFYTCLEKSGKSHGVLFLNSNAMDVTFLPAPAVTFRTIGGILDFFVFVGDEPEHVIKLYTSLVGRPMMPPYWALGFQLSRFGYNNIDAVKDAIERTRNASIPQAVQYLDIDHFIENKDFTYDSERFPDLPDYIEQTKKEHDLRWIVIVDPALPAESDYDPYSSGLKQHVFVNRPSFWTRRMFPEKLEIYNVTYGKVWPKSRVAFPDFFRNSTKQWWKDILVEYRKNISYDGLWIDMNEPANFATDTTFDGYCVYNRSQNSSCWGMKCPGNVLDKPPYNPVLESGDVSLSNKTICMDSVQGGDGSPIYKHYDVHSLYGWSETLPTLEAAQEATGERSLVISRSTYPSSGQFSGHWLGDNSATYDDMKRSIIGMLEFNMFGIPYVGADVCGFNGNPEPELCKRWMQLGAFYPFYRNHNTHMTKDQDPAAFSHEVAEASRKAVERRIGLNPYLYTLFYEAHKNGGTVVRPMFHEYPHLKETYNMSEQFMWGSSLLVAPVLKEGIKTISVFLPEDEWWIFKEKQSLYKPVKGWYVMQREADEYTPLYVRGGTILPYAKYKGLSDKGLENHTISLYVFPKNDKATGQLFADDGVSKDTVEKGEYVLYTFSYSNCTLNIDVQERTAFDGELPILAEVVVFKAKDIVRAGDYEVSDIDKRRNAAVVVGDANIMQSTSISWMDADGNCSMLA